MELVTSGVSASTRNWFVTAKLVSREGVTCGVASTGSSSLQNVTHVLLGGT